MYRNFYNNSLLSVALILAASDIFVTFVHDEPYDDAKSKSVERRALEKRVFSQVARDLNPKVYGEFEFRHGEIKVLRPGRLLKDFEVLEGSILLVGNGFTLTTDEALGRCFMSYYESGTLTLQWRKDTFLSKKTLTRDELSFNVVPLGHELRIEEKEKDKQVRVR